jgi:hypothetical protein
LLVQSKTSANVVTAKAVAAINGKRDTLNRMRSASIAKV